MGGWCVSKLRVIGGGRLPGVETWRNVVLFMALGSLRVRIAAREAGGLSVRPSVCAHCGRLPGGKKKKQSESAFLEIIAIIITCLHSVDCI